MSWYNYNITQENSFCFQSKIDNSKRSIIECWSETRENGPKRIDADVILRISLERGFEFFEKLKNDLERYSIKIEVVKSQLQDLTEKRNHYRSCYYVNIVGIENHIINIVCQVNGVFVEIRHSSFFLNNFTPQELEISRDYIKWIIGNARIKIDDFYNEFVLYEKLLQYFNDINNFIRYGGQLRKGGESLIEKLLISDFDFIKKYNYFSEFNIAHGERPIPLHNGNWGEIDIRLVLHTGDIKIDLAIEIQGPEHYGLGRGNNSRRFEIDFEKIQWCQKNNILFFWLDWESLIEYFLMDPSSSQKLRSNENRVNKLKSLIYSLINSYREGNLFCFLLDTDSRNNRILQNKENKYKIIFDTYLCEDSKFYIKNSAQIDRGVYCDYIG